MTGATVIQGSVKTFPQGLLEMIDELGILIKGDGLWHPMQAHNFFKNKLTTQVASKVFLHVMKWDIFRYSSSTTKIDSILRWVQGRPSIKSIYKSFHGAYGTGNGMYKPVF